MAVGDRHEVGPGGRHLPADGVPWQAPGSQYLYLCADDGSVE